jgi:hypothetical protein
MKHHEFIYEGAAPNDYRYNLVFSQTTHEIITLPAPALFDIQARGRYFIIPDDITNYNNMLAAAHDEEIHPREAQVPQQDQYIPGPVGFFQWK